MPERNPNSSCIAYSKFEFLSITPAVQPSKRRPGSLGYVQVIFRRKFPSYSYWLNRPMHWAEWQKGMRSASPGRWWNYQVKGRYN